MFQCPSSGRGHQATLFEFLAPLLVEICPMASRSARGKTLRQTSIRKSLQRAVNPTKTKSLFHDCNVWQYAGRGSLTPAHDDPTFLFL